MKENKFLDGISNIESDVVERFIDMDNKLQRQMSKTNSKKLWLRFGAIAACVILVLSAMLVAPMLHYDGSGGITPPNDTSSPPEDTLPPPESIEYSPIKLDATVSPERLNGSNLEFVIGSSLATDSTSSYHPNYGFNTDHFIVKAKVVKNYPDIYYKLDVSSEYKPSAYRLIRFETVDVIQGENVPKYFLYLIQNDTYVDMSVYDSLIISMEQLGAEKYVLKNDIQDKVEFFDIPVFADYQNSPELGNIIAFSDGIFDESLWQNESWKYGYQFAQIWCGNTESEVVARINEHIEHKIWPMNPYLITLDFKTQAAKDALEYVEPFKNGVFSQYISPYGADKLIVFRRFINGCQTEETISINIVTEEVIYSEVKYTPEDMAQMENLSLYLLVKSREYAYQTPAPPHTDTEGKKLLSLGLYAWYVKADGKIYGVIKTVWRYAEENKYAVQYYDDAYILYNMTDSTAVKISRDALIKIVGNRNVYTGEYGTHLPIVFD